MWGHCAGVLIGGESFLAPIKTGKECVCVRSDVLARLNKICDGWIQREYSKIDLGAIQGGLSSTSSWFLDTSPLSFSNFLLYKAHTISKKDKKYPESYGSYIKRIEEGYLECGWYGCGTARRE
ncbi:hypothetical protein BDR05DRAFT_956086 [Suillus weaverae]|nr:hypothetical protein BDR05DRAFT_956086 [Suillus weaverae]